MPAECYVQFPDLSELQCSSLSYGPPFLQTEFVFGITAPGSSDKTVFCLEEIGFKHLSSMNNWWPSHAGEHRMLKFWWKRTENKLPVACRRQKWKIYGEETLKFHSENTAYTGCGFKLGEIPLCRARFHQFFTLMRLPLQIVKFQEKWLERYHFRHIDTGTFAQYWVNGWKPKVYSVELENNYWKEYANRKKVLAEGRKSLLGG